ncbi:hypothetical protein M0R45_020176 [Rubus argutus]|uniref:Uncharacterized protein n=1 Tax=Rubus argutus TaxID=59490 RepID=A0AAW1XAW1_RUBAR
MAAQTTSLHRRSNLSLQRSQFPSKAAQLPRFLADISAFPRLAAPNPVRPVLLCHQLHHATSKPSSPHPDVIPLLLISPETSISKSPSILVFPIPLLCPSLPLQRRQGFGCVLWWSWLGFTVAGPVVLVSDYVGKDMELVCDAAGKEKQQPCSFRRRTHPVPPLKDAAPNLSSLPKPPARASTTPCPIQSLLSSPLPSCRRICLLPSDAVTINSPPIQARAFCFLAAVAVPSPLPLCLYVVVLPRSGLSHRCTSQPTQFTPLLQSPIQSAIPVRNHPSPPHNPAESSLS